MNRFFGRIGLAVILMGLFIIPVVSADAMMGGGGGGMGDGWQDWMNGQWGPPAGGYMWGGNDSWMIKGMLSAPVVGDDGTAYIGSYAPTAAGMISKISAIKLDATTATVALRGKVSVPVPFGAYLFATTSAPKLSDYAVIFNHGTNPAGEQSVLFRLPAPFVSTTIPDAAALDGRTASMPVVSANRIYVTTKDTYSGNKYLYVLNPDLTLVSKTTVQ